MSARKVFGRTRTASATGESAESRSISRERYEGYWENTKEKCRLYRIFVLFDEEDPRIFAKRFKKAYMSRIYADSMIRYNYYIENMPTHQIPEVDNEQVNRVLSLT